MWLRLVHCTTVDGIISSYSYSRSRGFYLFCYSGNIGYDSDTDINLFFFILGLPFCCDPKKLFRFFPITIVASANITFRWKVILVNKSSSQIVYNNILSRGSLCQNISCLSDTSFTLMMQITLQVPPNQVDGLTLFWITLDLVVVKESECSTMGGKWQVTQPLGDTYVMHQMVELS